jgi:hypothetical protein
MDWKERSLRLGDRRRKLKEFRLSRYGLSVFTNWFPSVDGVNSLNAV